MKVKRKEITHGNTHTETEAVSWPVASAVCRREDKGEGDVRVFGPRCQDENQNRAVL